MTHFLISRRGARFASMTLILLCLVTAPAAIARAQSGFTAADEARLVAELESIFGAPAGAMPRPPLERAREMRRSATPALAALALHLNELSPGTRETWAPLLLRPDAAGGSDPSGSKWSAGGSYTAATLATTHFVVHYVTAPESHPAYATAAYAQQVLQEIESTYSVMMGTLGWAAPPSDLTVSNNGGDARYDVYLASLGNLPGGGIFGYMATESFLIGGAGLGGVTAISYLVVDNNYTDASYTGGGGEPLAYLRVTLAHEFNHASQFAYCGDSYNTAHGWWYEATATYMEAQVYDSLDDYVRYLPAYFDYPDWSLREFGSTSLHPYGAAVWPHYLHEALGPAMIRDAWAATATGGSAHPTPLAALQAQLAARGTSLADEFARFSLWLALTGSRADAAYFPESAAWPELAIPADQIHAAYPAAGPVELSAPPQPLGSTHLLFTNLDALGARPARLTLDFQGEGAGTDWRLGWVARRADTGEAVFGSAALDGGARAQALVEGAQNYDWIIFSAANVNLSAPVDQTQSFTYSARLESSLGASPAWLVVE